MEALEYCFRQIPVFSSIKIDYRVKKKRKEKYRLENTDMYVLKPHKYEIHLTTYSRHIIIV